MPAAKIDVSQVIAFAPATDGYVPVTGAAGSAVAGDTVVVSTSTVATATASTINKNSFSFISSAYADSEAALTPLMELCDQAGVGCCTAQTDGSFECYLQANSSSTIYVAQTTDGTDVSANEETTPNMALLYLAQNPKDITNGPVAFTYSDSSVNVLWALTQDTGASIIESDNTFKVAGNHTQNYKTFDATGSRQLAYDENTDKLSGLTTAGLPVDSFDTTLGDLVSTAFSLDGTTTVPDTEIYNKVKYTADGKLRFVRKPILSTLTSGKKENIYYGLDSETDPIQFFDGSLSERRSLGITYVTNTIAFDVESSGLGLVLFEGNDGALRFRMAYTPTETRSYRYGGTNTLSITCSYDADGLCNYRDLQIYHENTSTTDYGRALLLDKENSRVGVVRYNYQDTTGSASINWVDLGEGKTPISMVLNSHKNKVYVLNKDNTISVITLKTPRGFVLAANMTVATIKLSDYLGEKNISITPTSLVYYANNSKGYLVVTAEGLKGAIVVDLDTATIAE